MILVVGENSVWQRTVILRELTLNAVNRAKTSESYSSGKGVNVIRALHSIGKEGFLLAYAGGNMGKMFIDFIENEGLSFYATKIKNETRICTTLIEEKETENNAKTSPADKKTSKTRITEIVEAAPAVTSEEREDFFKAFTERIKEASVLSISGTAVKGEDPNVYKRMIEIAREHGVITILDSHGKEAKIATNAAPDVLKINLEELKEFTDTNENTIQASSHKWDDIQWRRNVYRKFLNKTGIKWIIITMGKDGAEAFNGKDFYLVETPEITVRNSIGSGDSFTAGIAVTIESSIEKLDTNGAYRFNIEENCNIEDALINGTAMGTANCLNRMPGLIIEKDYRDMIKRVTVKRV